VYGLFIAGRQPNLSAKYTLTGGTCQTDSPAGKPTSTVKTCTPDYRILIQKHAKEVPSNSLLSFFH